MGDARLSCSAGNRRDQQHFIPVAKDIVGPAQEADVLLVYVDVEKAAHLPGLVAQVSLQFRKPFIENREQFSQVRGRTGDRAYARRVPPQGGWNLYRDRHFLLSTTLPPSPLLLRPQRCPASRADTFRTPPTSARSAARPHTHRPTRRLSSGRFQ